MKRNWHPELALERSTVAHELRKVHVEDAVAQPQVKGVTFRQNPKSTPLTANFSSRRPTHSHCVWRHQRFLPTQGGAASCTPGLTSPAATSAYGLRGICAAYVQSCARCRPIRFNPLFPQQALKHPAVAHGLGKLHVEDAVAKLQVKGVPLDLAATFASIPVKTFVPIWVFTSTIAKLLAAINRESQMGLRNHRQRSYQRFLHNLVACLAQNRSARKRWSVFISINRGFIMGEIYEWRVPEIQIRFDLGGLVMTPVIIHIPGGASVRLLKKWENQESLYAREFFELIDKCKFNGKYPLVCVEDGENAKAWVEITDNGDEYIDVEYAFDKYHKTVKIDIKQF